MVWKSEIQMVFYALELGQFFDEIFPSSSTSFRTMGDPNFAYSQCATRNSCEYNEISLKHV